ncbi:MAG: glutamyl-tRNA reductase, partial [Holdemanella sp.]|nr:glutamyl-tRNA reductase [Holdemanella sp.]
MEKLLNKMDTNINIVPFEKRYEIMHRCSCVISATSYPKYIIKEEKYLEQNYTIHHTFLDLALPRDIDEKLSNLHTVKIIDIDKLQSITDENYENRKKLANESRIMIDESINKLQHWLMTTNVDPTIQSIQDLCQKIVEDSYNYLDHKLSLDTRDKHLVKKVLEASLQRLLREPIREMKKIQDEDIQEEYIKVVQKLFQVDK